MGTQRKRSASGEATRDRIYEAATRVVASKGVEKATVTAICRGAQVSRGHLGYYLPRKDDLLLELVSYILRKGAARFAALEIDCTHPRIPSPIELRIRRNFIFFGEHPHYLSVFMLFFYRAPLGGKYRKMNADIMESVVGAYQKELEKRDLNSVEAHELATRIYGAMFFEIQRTYLLEPDSRENAGRQVENLLEWIARLCPAESATS